jgi:hypothetical protein
MTTDLADYLKKMIEAHPGLSYRRAAAEAGLSSSVVTQIISRVIVKPRPQTLEALARQWGTAMDYQEMMRLAGYKVPEVIEVAGFSPTKRRVVELLASERVSDGMAAAVAKLLEQLIQENAGNSDKNE